MGDIAWILAQLKDKSNRKGSLTLYPTSLDNP